MFLGPICFWLQKNFQVFIIFALVELDHHIYKKILELEMKFWWKQSLSGQEGLVQQSKNITTKLEIWVKWPWRAKRSKKRWWAFSKKRWTRKRSLLSKKFFRPFWTFLSKREKIRQKPKFRWFFRCSILQKGILSNILWGFCRRT